MSHSQQLQYTRFWRRKLSRFFARSRVLEVGSLDINGSVRRVFRGAQITGIDIGEGPGVDIVAAGHEYDAPDASFDFVISCECMEHNPYWAETIRNMIRMLRPGGFLLMTFAGYGRPEHGTSRSWSSASPLTIAAGWDYYRNLGRAEMDSIAELRDGFDPLFYGENWESLDFYVAGLKKGPAPSGRSGQEESSQTLVREFAKAEREVRKWLRRKNRGWRQTFRRWSARLRGDSGVNAWMNVERRLSR